MQHRYTCSVLVSKCAILTCKMLLPWVITKASIACIMQSIFIATAVATFISGYFFLTLLMANLYGVLSDFYSCLFILSGLSLVFHTN